MCLPIKLLCLVFTLVLLSSQTYAQISNEQKIAEVYGSDFFVSNPQLKDHFYILLQERIEYKQAPLVANEKYPLLSAAALMNRYNPNMVRDIAFDQQTFNPLKYNLNFFAATTQVYRIDGTDFLIVISPQKP